MSRPHGRKVDERGSGSLGGWISPLVGEGEGRKRTGKLEEFGMGSENSILIPRFLFNPRMRLWSVRNSLAFSCN